MTEYGAISKLAGAAEVRVALSEYKGKQRVDVREFFLDAAGNGKPTRRGVNLAIEDLPTLLGLLQAAEADALRRGLLEMEDFEVAHRPVPPELLEAA